MSARAFGKRSLKPKVSVRAPAKVNLHLEVIRQRHDGYHEIETIFQAVQLFDTVTVSLLEKLPPGKPIIDIIVQPAGTVPTDKTNLCWQAVTEFCRHAGCSGKFLIELNKRIPTAAGLGGGSSDAAAVLVACDALLGTDLDSSVLEKIGTQIGSDVPFFIKGGTALGRGRGTDLFPLPAIRSGQFLIVKPNIKLLSSNVYGNLKMGLTVRSLKANIQGLRPLLVRFPTSSWFGFNRLEEVVLPSNPLLQRLIIHLQEVAPVVMLSGSGAAVVAVFKEGEDIPPLPVEFVGNETFMRVVSPWTVGVDIVEG